MGEKLVAKNWNPLLEGLADYPTNKSLVMDLLYNEITLDAANKSSTRKLNRVEAVAEIQRTCIPTRSLVSLARATLDAVTQGLQNNNPRDPNWVKVLNKIADIDPKTLKKGPQLYWNPKKAGGFTVKSISSCGKSFAEERMLSLIPQVVIHAAKGGAAVTDCGVEVRYHDVDASVLGFVELINVRWLKVSMPARGTEGGLALNILWELGRITGRPYFEEYRRMTVERQSAICIHLLHLHCVGLLIVEELQYGNLVANKAARDIVNLFLTIMNSGTSLGLIGNPLAFEVFKSHMQDRVRLSEYGTHTFFPYLDATDPEWQRLVKGLWPVEPIMGLPATRVDGLCELLLELTGGIVRFLTRARRVLVSAAYLEEREIITEEFMRQMFETESSLIEVQDIVSSLRDSTKAAKRWVDVPVADVRRFCDAVSKIGEKFEDFSDQQAGERPSRTGVGVANIASHTELFGRLFN